MLRWWFISSNRQKKWLQIHFWIFQNFQNFPDIFFRRKRNFHGFINSSTGYNDSFNSLSSLPSEGFQRLISMLYWYRLDLSLIHLRKKWKIKIMKVFTDRFSSNRIWVIPYDVFKIWQKQVHLSNCNSQCASFTLVKNISKLTH